MTRKELPKDYPVDVHFNPPYNPWDQRLCSVPEGDLFKTISAGKADVVTDHVERFTEHGVLLKSGKMLKADIIITATGLNVQLFGGITLYKDGKPVVLSETIAYKGMMLSGVPNFAFAVGYTNSSWTLKVCLLCDHFAACWVSWNAKIITFASLKHRMVSRLAPCWTSEPATCSAYWTACHDRDHANLG